MASLSEVCSSQSNTKEQKIMGDDTPYLPQEIITNILKRLPVKSLIRFQCVCTDWKNLIKTPSFVADHLRHSTHQNPSLLFQQNCRDDPLHLCLLDCKMQLHEVENLPSSKALRIVGSSNGLLLCVELSSFGASHSLFLCNPAIRKIRQVPGIVYDFDGDFCVGFGFSPIVNDYKILRAYVPQDKDDVNRVDVYSLSTQRWKEIKLGNLKGVNLYCESITANGAMFWLGTKLIMEEELYYHIDLIVSFDIAMEAFTLIAMPALGSNSRDKLTVHENKLAVITQTRQSESFSTDSWLIDLWVMEEGMGVPQERWSWTKKYSVRTFLGSLVPLGSWRMNPLCIWRDEMVCNINDVSGLIGETECEEYTEVIAVLSLLNIRTNELRKIATSRYGHVFSVIFNHTESLVPIDSIHVEEPLDPLSAYFV
ncbi:F-box protein At3g08750-like [Prosopis cineraria]|uniref:F-box protein At3g08750-like n=1 Tax=Prosopis cineraria TaxID=364024 RepID=UPI00240FEAFF|nr:F-box protein At3g08750-like [Prosopis cineraria]